MHSHRWMPASVLTVLLAMQSTVSNADPRIGTAASTRPSVEAVAGGNTQTLSAGSEIYANQTVRTGNRGMADLVFLDKTNLSVGPTSEVRLDKFVYDPNARTGAVVLDATRGAYRFITGVQDHRNYEIKIPYATLGVRGTILEIDLYALEQQPRDPCECYVRVKLVEGAFEARTISG